MKEEKHVYVAILLPIMVVIQMSVKLLQDILSY